MEIILDLCGPGRCARLRCPAAGLDTQAVASDGRDPTVWAGEYGFLGRRAVRSAEAEALRHLGPVVGEFRGPTASVYLHVARPGRAGATAVATHCFALSAADFDRLDYLMRSLSAPSLVLKVHRRGWLWRLFLGRTRPLDPASRPWRGDLSKVLLPAAETPPAAAPRRPAARPQVSRRAFDEDRETGLFAYSSSFPSAAGQGSPAAFREWREWAGGGGAAGGAGASGAWVAEGEVRATDMPRGVPGFPAAVRQEIRNEGGALTIGLLDAAGRQVGGWRMPEGLAGPLVLEDGSRLTVTDSGVEMRSEGGVALAWRDAGGEVWQSLASDSTGGGAGAREGADGGGAGQGADSAGGDAARAWDGGAENAGDEGDGGGSSDDGGTTY